MPVEKALRRLQATVRARDSTDGVGRGRSGRVPADIAGTSEDYIALTEGEEAEFGATADELLRDLRFEHLGHRVDAALWRFVCLAQYQRDRSHVTDFVTEHAIEPEEVAYTFTVEHLSVRQPVAVGGAKLLPLDGVDLPPDLAQWLRLEPPVGAFIRVTAYGTSEDAMATRARSAATHALHVLRLALRENPGITNDQLRFRRGEEFFTNRGRTVWERMEGAPVALDDLPPEVAESVSRQPVSQVTSVATTDAERRICRAIDWAGRARLATDDLTALLFLFFALEALLGDTSEKLKGPLLTARRVMLAHVVSGEFLSPAVVYFLYADVRSAAVHGEESPAVHEDDVATLHLDVRRAINEYVTLVLDVGLQSRHAVVAALRGHEDSDQVLAWLTENFPTGDEWRL